MAVADLLVRFLQLDYFALTPYREYIPANTLVTICSDKGCKITYRATQENYRIRIFDFNETTFNIRVTPASCDLAKPHKIALSFFDTWIPGDILKMEHIENNAFVIKREGVHIESRFYGIRAKSKKPCVNFRFGENAVIFLVNLTKGNSSIEERGGKKEPCVLETRRARYFALFANQMDNCPTFISMVDESFPFWDRSKPKGMEGVPGTGGRVYTTVLREVTIASILVFFYYHILTKFILPVYFHFKVPVRARPPLAQSRMKQPVSNPKKSNREAKQLSKDGAAKHEIAPENIIMEKTQKATSGSGSGETGTPAPTPGRVPGSTSSGATPGQDTPATPATPATPETAPTQGTQPRTPEWM
ncbi:unnamed protein product [Cylicocyclus nassatus]|uniref:Uncharacterized protein n=1 Tax=Cylicocyclus nassatus TaxID=53992 RepID=A0AA36M9C0_CYLNA|nr:unnamed protein product [Cylicocyclus nassatus]